MTQRIDFLKAYIPPNKRGAEIGVWRGGFAHRLRETLRPSRLYLIDPWELSSKNPTSIYGVNNTTQKDLDIYYHKVCQRFKNNPRVKILRDRSENIMLSLKLDWVYVDGDHSYDATKQDLVLSRKSGAIYIAGHDYVTGSESNAWFGDGVYRAVNDFVEINPYALVEGNNRQFLLIRTYENHSF